MLQAGGTELEVEVDSGVAEEESVLQWEKLYSLPALGAGLAASRFRSPCMVDSSSPTSYLLHR